MLSDAFVKLALDTIPCNQKELAARLAVSPTQITKWKQGEHMSHDMEEKFRKITKIGNKNPQFVLWSGSLEDACKWENLIDFISEIAVDSDETGYITAPLTEDLYFLCEHTFYVIKEMGIKLPKKFPKELDINYKDDESDNLYDLLDTNPYCDVIYKIFKSLTDVYGFYAAYVSELIDDEELDLYSTPAENIEPCLLSLAASKIEIDEKFAPNFRKFKYQTINDYEQWLTIVKDRAFRAGIPLRAELLNLVYSSSDELGCEAEAEGFGFNSSRIHPDIYMNELLVGMRTIHQVLPAIMKKLDIFDDFKLDESEFNVK